MGILGYSFQGPYEIGKRLIDRAAVYVILDAERNIVDVGQSGEAGTRLRTHERRACWERNRGNWFVVKFMPSTVYSRENREALESQIRSVFKPPCGKK